MMFTNQPEDKGSLVNSHNQAIPTYKGWLITTQVINGKLWLRWQHPKECFPRYGCPVSTSGIAATIDHVRFLIDLAIKLESESPVSTTAKTEYSGFLWN